MEILASGIKVNVLAYTVQNSTHYYFGIDGSRSQPNYLLCIHQTAGDQKTKEPILLGYYGQSIPSMIEGAQSQFFNQVHTLPKEVFTDFSEYLTWVKEQQSELLTILETQLEVFNK